ncbi:unnamed protein product [Brassica oleracea var. botrytis]
MLTKEGNTNNNNKNQRRGAIVATNHSRWSSTPPATQSPPYPSPAFYYPSPAENLPNYPSPPSEGEGGGSFYGPPPPDAILPYFPYYFRNPSHQTDQTSSSQLISVPGTLTANIVVVGVLVTSGN